MTMDGNVLVLSGTVDEHTLAALRGMLTGLASTGRPVVVDLGDVDYLPSAGIGVLAEARTAALEQGGTFTLVAPEGKPAQRVLEITGFPHVTSRQHSPGAGDGPGSAAG
ncbi:MAG: hypothetical protein CMH83_01705 [Nocardioides sp.]|nr:hypothetical protein [Nocardioides sp.]